MSEDILCEMNLKPAHLVQVNVKASLDGFNQLHLRTHRSRYLSVRRQLATVKLRYLKEIVYYLLHDLESALLRKKYIQCQSIKIYEE